MTLTGTNSRERLKTENKPGGSRVNVALLEELNPTWFSAIT